MHVYCFLEQNLEIDVIRLLTLQFKVLQTTVGNSTEILCLVNNL